MAILGGGPISSAPISGLEGVAAPAVQFSGKPLIVSQAVARQLRPVVQAPIVTGGRDGEIAVADSLATKPVVVLQDGKTKPVIPAIVTRAHLEDTFVAPYTFQNVTQAVARPLFPATPAPIIKIGTEDIFVAPYTFQNVTQAVARPLFPATPAPIIVRGGEDAVVVQNEASPDPVVVSQAIARPLAHINFSPIIRGGTQDVPFAPYTFNNISQAAQSRLRPPPIAAVIVKGGEVAVVATASPLPVNISQAVARSLNPQIFGPIIITGNDGNALPPEPPVEEEDRGKSGKRVYEDYDPYYYKKRNKRRTTKADIEGFLAEAAAAPVQALPVDLAAQHEAARIAAQEALTLALANSTKIALKEINAFYSLLREAIKLRKAKQELEDDEDEDVLLLISAELF